jgi:pyruvate/2-oxoglutarate dehydrogenase complex dihydrolipoamide dehydrogenase (E3) component
MNYEVAVIGSGSAGKEAALLAAKEGRHVVLIEKETLGGTCYHPGLLCHSNFAGLRQCFS